MNERRSFSHRVVFGALGVSLLLAAAAAFHIYRRYVQFEPLAERHVPEQAAVAVRLNVEQAVVYEPFRRHLLPLFELGREAPESRLKHFERETSIELGVDLRELILVTMDRGEWLVLLGGHFRRDGVVAGAQRMLAAEGLETARFSSPERLVHDSGVSFGVAPDGVLMLASSERLLLDAWSERRSGGPRFSSEAALEFLAENRGGPQAVRGVHLLIWPGQTFRADLQVSLRPQAMRDDELLALLTGRTGDFVLLGPDVDLELAQVTPEKISAFAGLSREQFDRTVDRLALDVRRWF